MYFFDYILFLICSFGFYLIRIEGLRALGIYLDKQHIWEYVSCSAQVFVLTWRSKYTPEMCDFLFVKALIQVGHVLPSTSPAFDVLKETDAAVIVSKLTMNLHYSNLAPQHMIDNHNMGYWPMFCRNWIQNLGWRDDVTAEGADWFKLSCQQKLLRDMDMMFKPTEYDLMLLNYRGDSGTWKLETLRKWQKSKKET